MRTEQVRSMAADTRGKHRISAALKRLEQETHSIQEEVEQLEKMGAASGVCKEILNDVETRPDPLLPTTNGPTTPLWDRWFERPQNKSDCRCRIL
ncbi:guanine nucleotide-binding protein subunit gamma 2-like [Cynara cardunculus var. scolymus]|uniref:guanine nucleotide-binding protein subunit gamma 2-like n=1 Tax=Cynara cardunculus var. scolymus TaxID=59895 RepID=UPI000D62D0E7|nr:guanine nucleotide-binding protein subunit gamma 2-like [Cynara cardunculus var. scolymus]